VLLYGRKELDTIINSEQRNQLLDEEFIDWISSLYWGETLGVQYAMKMGELSPRKEDKVEWQNTLIQEMDHQQRLLKWMLDNDITLRAPNRLLKVIGRIVDKGSTAKDLHEYKNVIKDGQIFLEELGVTMIRWRLPLIKNKSLRSLLLKIVNDEAKHISNGKRTLKSIGELSLPKQSNMELNILKLFPLQIAKNILPPDQYLEVKNLSQDIMAGCLEEIMSAKVFKPLEILEKFCHVEGYECFGCHPAKSEGLLLEPVLVDGEIFDNLNLGKSFVGMNGLVHGGFISMALDEIMGYAITLGKKRFSLTTKLEVKFLKPMVCGKDYRINSRIVSEDGNKIAVTGEIVSLDGEVIASAAGDFYIIGKNLGEKLFPTIVSNPHVSYMFN
jgi:acyl-coenzyme A thioesterase PaaI-like protein